MGMSDSSTAPSWGAPTTPGALPRASSPDTPAMATAPPRASGTGACGCCWSPTVTVRLWAMTFGPQRERARGRLRALNRASREHPVRRRGHGGREYHDSLQLIGVQLIGVQLIVPTNTSSD